MPALAACEAGLALFNNGGRGLTVVFSVGTEDVAHRFLVERLGRVRCLGAVEVHFGTYVNGVE